MEGALQRISGRERGGTSAARPGGYAQLPDRDVDVAESGALRRQALDSDIEQGIRKAPAEIL